MTDSEIIKLFFDRSEKAIEALESKYGRLLMRISLNILNNLQDAEECINDVCLRVWKLIPPEKPENLSAYVSKIARNVSIERYKRNAAIKRKGNYDLCLDELDGLISDRNAENDYDAYFLAGAIDVFLATLTEENRMIFVRRFWYMDSYKDISKASRLNEGAVRTRISRMKNDLRVFLEQRGIMI